jgi:hypothetical protein
MVETARYGGAHALMASAVQHQNVALAIALPFSNALDILGNVYSVVRARAYT